jgi:predicted PurR-regulated permease PerM
VNRRVEDFADLFKAPAWLRDLGATAWLLVGVTLFVVGVVWFLSLTQTIVMPVIAASVVAAVASPLVSSLERHRVPRALGALILFIGFIVLGALITFIVVAGIADQFDAIKRDLRDAKDSIATTLNDLGLDKSTAQDTTKDASSSISDIVPTLLHGVSGALKQLSSLAFFLALTLLSLFFLLKDGPQIRSWAEGHMRVPRDVAHQIMGRVLSSMRGYFLGVTIVAAFNAVVVGAGALILGVPVVGTIAMVTFLGAYIPYLGAWSAGAFSVLMALGGAGTDAAIGMIVVQLLANGLLQQMVQPIAMGATLGIHPLAVLIVTIAGGALFGAAGLILAAPLTSAAVKIASDLSARAPAPA